MDNKKNGEKKQRKKAIKSNIAAVIFCAVAMVFLTAVLKPVFVKKPIFVFGYSVCIVATSSMSPSYPASSMVFLKKFPSSMLKEGDVVAFKSDALGGAVALHRITQIVEGGFFTKGDQNTYSDGQLITPSDYVGKCTVRRGLKLNSFARIFTSKGLLVYVLCPLIAIWAGVKAKKVLLKIQQ